METEYERVGIRHLLGLTTLCALALGLGRLLGSDLSFALFLAAYAFAPSLALGAAWVLRKQSPRVRWWTCGALMFGLAVAMGAVCAYCYGSQAFMAVMMATLIEWPGQFGVLLCLGLIRHSARQRHDEKGRASFLLGRQPVSSSSSSFGYKE